MMLYVHIVPSPNMARDSRDVLVYALEYFTMLVARLKFYRAENCVWEVAKGTPTMAQGLGSRAWNFVGTFDIP